MPDTALHPLRRAVEKFWAPVPWMLEAEVVLELALGKYVEAAVIAGLLLFNAVVGLVQEGRAQHTLLGHPPRCVSCPRGRDQALARRCSAVWSRLTPG